MHRLRDIISNKVKDEEFKEHPYSIKFMHKEHFYYYKIYREVAGEIPKAQKGEKPCPACSAGMPEQAFHYRVCGNV